ncbi:hypothetical protein SAMN05421819_3633 [Bryocella elongata]|uniref:Uncharacterized protein n=1 Tax=Bryocella elongata TaxID=863522 RepID=A0A1H6BB25_9BACT|nr:hypothetical protein [Bryocella elongata]SEG57376.1 hypothetical protein SAMN05421819_3633 [Bryocella elongata]
MGLDIRLPLGLLFLILGVIMVVHGAMTRGSDIYASSGGMNINLIWGLVMLLFGLIMFLAARRSSK